MIFVEFLKTMVVDFVRKSFSLVVDVAYIVIWTKSICQVASVFCLLLKGVTTKKIHSNKDV